MLPINLVTIFHDDTVKDLVTTIFVFRIKLLCPPKGVKEIKIDFP